MDELDSALAARDIDGASLRKQLVQHQARDGETPLVFGDGITGLIERHDVGVAPPTRGCPPDGRGARIAGKVLIDAERAKVSSFVLCDIETNVAARLVGA